MATLIDFVNAVKAQLNGKAASNHTHAQYIDTNDSRLNHDHSVYVKTVNNEPPDVLGNVDISGAGLSYVQVVSGSEVRPSAPIVFWIGGETEPTNMVVGDVWFKEGQAVPPPTEPVAPTITTTSLNAMTVSAPFTQTLVATGDAPITWAVTAGTLVPGLTLSAAGVLSGTPTTEGAYNFTVTTTNSAGSDTQQYTGTVAAAPTGGGSTTHSVFDPAAPHPYTHTLFNDGGGALQVANAFYGTQPFRVEKVRLWLPSAPVGSGDLRLWVALGGLDAGGQVTPPPWAGVSELEALGRLVTIPQAGLVQGWNEVALPSPPQVNPMSLAASSTGVFAWAGYSFSNGNHYVHSGALPSEAITSPTAPWFHLAENPFATGQRGANSVPTLASASYGLDLGVSTV